MQAECINSNFYVHITPGTGIFKGKEKESKQQSWKVRKDIDPCDVYGSLVQQPKQPNRPPNGHTVTLLRFIWSNVFTYYSCGEKFYHQAYPDALGDLILVLKTKRVFDNPATHERTHKIITLVMFVIILSLNVFLHMIAALPFNLKKKLKCVLKRCLITLSSACIILWSSWKKIFLALGNYWMVPLRGYKNKMKLV